MARLIRRGERLGREPDYLAVTLSGLEDALSRELESLGATNCEVLSRAVRFRATVEVSYRILLETRLAMRLLRPLSRFSAASREELYSRSARLPWEQVIGPESTFAIRPQSHSSIFRTATFASQVVKDAIVDRQRGRGGRRSSIDSESPDVQLVLRIRETEVEISLDATVEPLSRRGYRRSGGVAPLNEVLAAGIIDLAGWDGETPLFDPFCGSATLLAEAAIKLYAIPPNRGRRDWAHRRWPDFDEHGWQRAVEGALRPRERSARQSLLFGMDRDAAQLSAGRENLRRLGVEDRVTLKAGDTLKTRVGEFPGVGDVPPTVITNLPYGERSGGGEQIEELYRSLGNWLKEELPGSTAWLLTGNLEASRSFGLRTRSRRVLYNGPIECRLLEFNLY